MFMEQFWKIDLGNNYKMIVLEYLEYYIYIRTRTIYKIVNLG